MVDHSGPVFMAVIAPVRFFEAHGSRVRGCEFAGVVVGKAEGFVIRTEEIGKLGDDDEGLGRNRPATHGCHPFHQ